MADTIYDFSTKGDTLNGRVNRNRLGVELRNVASPLMSARLIGVSFKGDILSLTYDDALRAGDQAILGAVVGAHAGSSMDEPEPLVTAHMVNPSDIVSQSWVDIGSVVTRPESFAFLTDLLSRSTMAVQVSGSMDIRIAERDEDQTERSLHSVPFSAVDTASLWKFVSFDSDTPALPGTHEYILQAKMVGPTDVGKIRGATFTMVRIA